MQRIDNPINAIDDIIAALFKAGDALTRYLQLGL